jgi:PPK2 family polyphosphate:nucleotide phosphotransferase
VAAKRTRLIRGTSMNPLDHHLIRPGSSVDLSRIDPAGSPAFPPQKGEKNGDVKARAEEELCEHTERIAHLQEFLYAQNTTALLVVLQGMDTSGKDGVIRHVFSGVNPQGCHVTSFKKPSETEADRDYLWRIHAAVPGRGEIGVFNRAHYEDVLVVRVHEFVPKSIWQQRYDQINQFEHYLSQNHVVILKFMLHISKDEQKRRLQARLDDPEKRWKFNSGDLADRTRWDEYQKAYEAALSRCSTEWAPWHVIPSDRKWYQRWVIASIVRRTLESLDPKPPKATFDPATIRID